MSLAFRLSQKRDAVPLLVTAPELPHFLQRDNSLLSQFVSTGIDKSASMTKPFSAIKS